MTETKSGDAFADKVQESQPSVRVRVVPADIDIDVRAGETLLEAAVRMGIQWPSICGGQCVCTTCYVKVTEGMEAASLQGRAERERLEFVGRRDPSIRLACQLRVSGPMRVIQRGVKPPTQQK
jgi:ferredoxin, 2Fe-2S